MARFQGAGCSPNMYGMNGTMPAIVNMVEGSGEISEALGTTSWPREAKKFSQRRRISAVCMVYGDSYQVIKIRKLVLLGQYLRLGHQNRMPSSLHRGQRLYRDLGRRLSPRTGRCRERWGSAR